MDVVAELVITSEGQELLSVRLGEVRGTAEALIELDHDLEPRALLGLLGVALHAVIEVYQGEAASTNDWQVFQDVLMGQLRENELILQLQMSQDEELHQ